ncbi:MAG: TlpA disulfide reductase family protein [Rubripirellula sp.]
MRFQYLTRVSTSLCFVCALSLLMLAGCSRQSSSSSSSSGQTFELTVGDRAPPVAISQLVWGSPVSESAASGVQVVEFWATWCGPCRQGMPHLSSLQQSYGEEVTIVGITDEDVGTVEAFLDSPSATGATWREVIKYRLAIDDRGATNAAYMKASGQRGIPTAFIVGRDGTLEWIGHPGNMDQPLRSIVGGTWDRAEVKKQFELQAQTTAIETELRKALSRAKWNEALAAIDSLEALSGKSEETVRMREAVNELSTRGG